MPSPAIYPMLLELEYSAHWYRILKCLTSRQRFRISKRICRASSASQCHVRYVKRQISSEGLSIYALQHQSEYSKYLTKEDRFMKQFNRLELYPTGRTGRIRPYLRAGLYGLHLTVSHCDLALTLRILQTLQSLERLVLV